jgi:hypothetical protein
VDTAVVRCEELSLVQGDPLRTERGYWRDSSDSKYIIVCDMHCMIKLARFVRLSGNPNNNMDSDGEDTVPVQEAPYPPFKIPSVVSGERDQARIRQYQANELKRCNELKRNQDAVETDRKQRYGKVAVVVQATATAPATPPATALAPATAPATPPATATTATAASVPPQ